MSYRDDLAAAHARIAALEAQLRSAGASTGGAGLAELEQLRAEHRRVLEDNERLRTLLAAEQVRIRELERLREERNRLVERVRVLQRRDDGATAARATAPAPTPAPAPPRPAKRPTVWEHNRALPPIRRGEGAGVWCPSCRAAGEEVELARKLGRFVKASTDADYESVACPRCLFTALRRRR